MSNYEKLLAHPDVECVHPKFIAVVGGKKEFVAEVVDGTVYLTDAGKQLLAAEGDVDTKKSGKRGKKPVESTYTSVDDVDDLELSE